jgi:hypothetical protein
MSVPTNTAGPGGQAESPLHALAEIAAALPQDGCRAARGACDVGRDPARPRCNAIGGPPESAQQSREHQPLET